MPEFRYKAIDDGGNSHKGTLAADNETHLETLLNEGGFYLLEATTKYPLVKSAPKVETATGEQHGPPPDGVHLHQHLHQDFSLDFNAPLIMGLIGLLLIIGGCFAPFFQIPLLGSYSMVLDGRGDGVFVVVLSGVAIWLLLIRRYKLVLIPAGISAAIVLEDVVRVSKVGAELSKGGVTPLHLSWGVGLLIIGYILVFVGVGMGIKSSRRVSGA